MAQRPDSMRPKALRGRVSSISAASDTDNADVSFVNRLHSHPEIALHQVEVGLRDVRRLASVLGKISALDIEYCKKVQRLVSDDMPHFSGNSGAASDSLFSLRNLTLGLLTALQDAALLRRQGAITLQKDVTTPLLNFQREASDRLKRLCKKEKDERSKLVSVSNTVDKQHHKCLQLHESSKAAKAAALVATIPPDDAKSNKFTRFTDRLVGTLSNRPLTLAEADERLDQATEQYSHSIRDASKMQDRYFDSVLPKLLRSLEALERERGLLLQSQVQVHNMAQQELVDGLQDIADRSKDLSNAVNVKEDIRSFITHAVSQLKDKPSGIKRRKFEYDLPISKKNSLFRKSVTEICVSDESALPRLFEVLEERLIALDGLKTEGIFRISVDKTELQTLKRQIDNGELDRIEMSSPHMPACLIKEWLREIPSALVPESEYELALAIGNAEKESDADINRLLNALPKPNRLLLQRISKLCARIALNESQTRMSLHNLSVVFTPCLVRAPESASASALLHNSRKELAFTQRLLQRLDAMH